MDFKPDFLGYEFTWFIGEVEEREDPLKVGRVKVRCFGWHSTDKEELPTKDLPWAQTIQPVTAPAAAPSGLTVGIWVFGFFMDGEKAQRPMIMGQIPGYRYNTDGTSESELPRAARAEANLESSQSKLRRQTRVTDIGLQSDQQWSEPAELEDKKYPYVQTVGSEPGFITETIHQVTEAEKDDSFVGPMPSVIEARQVSYDCNGGYEERRSPSGDKITKVIGNNYVITCGSNFVNIQGDVNMTVNGSMRTNIAGDYELNVGGNMYTVIGGKEDRYTTGDQIIGIAGTRDTYIGGFSPTGGIGDNKVVAAGGVNDRVLLGIRNIQSLGGVTDGASLFRTNVTNGSYTETSCSHIILLGTGTITTTGSITATALNSTTLTVTGLAQAGTVTSTVPKVVTLGTHIHTAAGGPTTAPL